MISVTFRASASRLAWVPHRCQVSSSRSTRYAADGVREIGDVEYRFRNGISGRQNDVLPAARKSFSIGLIGLLMGNVAIGPTLLCLLLNYMGNELYICRPMGFGGLARLHRLHAPRDGPAPSKT
jgi:hypothetical protein